MDRPAFNRMKSDIEAGKIGIVITKDFSRLGRNTGQVMTMLDDFFLRHHVQYIAVSEGIDTLSGESSGLLAPILSFTNEMYAGDISRKINSAFGVKMQGGEFIGAFAPYGYRKDPQNKNHLVRDDEAAETVKHIFTLARDGYSPRQISERLNEDGVLTPSLYRYKVNPHLDTNSFRGAKQWSVSTVSKLLRNEVYLGDMLQGKTHKPSYKNKLINNIPKPDWIRVDNTHEALIDEETWDIVRKKMQSRTQKREKGFVNLFSGIAVCADCGKNMSSVGTRKKGAKANLNCGGYKLHGREGCTNHTIDYDTLYNAVLTALREQISFTEEERNALLHEMLEGISVDTSKLDDARKKLDSISSKLAQLFDGKFSGEIDEKTFETLRSKYEKETASLESVIAEQERINALKQDKNELVYRHDKFQALISEYENLQALDSEILFRLIDRIEVHQGEYIKGVKHQQIDIYFKFQCEPSVIKL